MKNKLLNSTYLRVVIVLLHAFLWLALFSLYRFAFSNLMTEADAFSRAIFMTLHLILVWYCNTLILIDLFLDKKRYVVYIVALFLLIGVALLMRFTIDNTYPIESLISVNKPYLFSFTPIISCLIISTILQLLMNYYSRAQNQIMQINHYMEAEVQFLKNQINPHFLFNNLNNIYSLVVTKSPEAPQMIIKLSDLLRYVLYKSSQEKVSVLEELEQIKNLSDLFKLKDETNENIKINSSELTSNVFIAPMIMIPLVENCFKHCDTATNPNAFITIELATKTINNLNYFSFKTINSSAKKEKKISDEDGGIGLENIKKRLAITYKGKASLVHNFQNNVFTAELLIPC